MTRLQADLLFVIVTLIWGTTFVAQNLGTKSLGPLTFTGIRFLLGFLVVLPFAFMEWRRLVRRGTQFDLKDLLGGAGLGVLLFLGAACQQKGIMDTTVSNAGFLTALYVPLVPLLSWWVHGKRPHPSLGFAVALCLGGTWLLSGGALSALSNGDYWVIVSTLFWAAHILYVAPVADRKAAPLFVASLQFLSCGILGCAFGLVSEDFHLDKLIDVAGSVAYAGFLSVGIAFTLQVVAQRHTPAADAAILMSAEMLVAAVAGAIMLGERLMTLQWVGGLLILASIILVQLLPMIFPNYHPVSLKKP